MAGTTVNLIGGGFERLGIRSPGGQLRGGRRRNAVFSGCGRNRVAKSNHSGRGVPQPGVGEAGRSGDTEGGDSLAGARLMAPNKKRPGFKESRDARTALPQNCSRPMYEKWCAKG